MSAQQLIDTIKCLEYPGAASLDADAFDWMFEQEKVALFLEQFCNHVSKSNLLKKKELDEYVILYTCIHLTLHILLHFESIYKK